MKSTHKTNVVRMPRTSSPMKRIMLSLMLLVLSSQAYAAVSLVQNGKSNYVIVLSRSASPSEKHAANELQNFVQEISGAKLPIAYDSKPKPAKMILLGDSKYLRSLKLPINYKTLGNEGFVIKTAGPHLVITGGRQRGSMYGVYEFLEKYLGCRWYTPFVSRIPKRATIVLADIDTVQKPDFESRDLSMAGRLYPQWCVRNRINGHASSVNEKLGGKVSFYGFVHTFRQLVPEEEYFEKHPEYFSLVDGVRRGGLRYQLCLSNPEVVKIATHKLMKWIDDNPTCTFFGVSQNDNINRCECEDCRRIEREEGSSAGLLLRFVNAIADEVAKKHPDKLVDTLAYQYTENPPKITRPRSNICVRLAPVDACMYHPYGTCKESMDVAENIRGWHKICNRIYVWHYAMNFASYMQPCPDIKQLSDNLKFYHQNGVNGFFAQGQPGPGESQYGGTAWMSDLKQYLLAKLTWDASTDADKIIDDFLSGVYGKSAGPIRQIINLYQNKVSKENIHSGGIYDSPDSAFLTPDVLDKADRLYSEAEKLTGNQDILERIKRDRLSVRCVRVMQKVEAAKRSLEPAAVKEALALINSLAAEYDRYGLPRYGDPFTASEMVAYYTKILTVTHDFAQTTSDKAHYLDGSMYSAKMKSLQTLLDLPVDGWAFKTDEETVGTERGYFLPEFSDKDLPTIRVDNFWTKQGYPLLHDGWYRLRFTCPEFADGKRVYLNFGGIDESAWVYIDGKLTAWYDSADAGRTWDQPVLFDVTGSLKSGKDHLLAIRIQNTEAAGGVWKPVSIMIEKVQPQATTNNLTNIPG